MINLLVTKEEQLMEPINEMEEKTYYMVQIERFIIIILTSHLQ